MPRVPRWLLPAAVGLTGLGVLAVAATQVAPLRAEERAAQAAREQAAFRTLLRPLAESVFDQVQPLQDAFDQFDKPHPDDLQVRDDVLRASVAVPALQARRKELKAFDVPDAYTAPVRDLLTSLDLLETAAVRLRKATGEKGDAEGEVAGFGSGQGILESAEIAWQDALLTVYGERDAPSMPSTDRTLVKRGRSPLSRGAYVYQADRTCGSSSTAGDALPDPTDLGSFLRLLPKQIALTRGATTRLQAVPLPPPDAARLKKDVVAPLGRFLQQATIAERIVSRPGVTPGAGDLATLKAADETLRGLSKALTAYGATLCGDYFDPGPPLDGGAGEDAGDTARA